MRKSSIRGLIGILLGATMLGTAVPASSSQVAPPLEMTPQNTVIVDGSAYAGTNLQYYLVKFYVGENDAALLAAPQVDRSAVPSFPIFKNDAVIPANKNIIALGRTRYLSDAEKARLDAAPNGATLIKREGNVVVVAGSPFDNGWLGDFTAMSDFLNYVCGIRFYGPGDLWISRPKTTSISIGDLDSFREEAFATTYLAPWYKRNQDWARLNYTANRITINVNHNLGNIFPPAKYGKTNPDIYELRGGQRLIPPQGSGAWQPSLVAPELPDLTMVYIREQMKRTPNLKYISLGMMDIDFHDESPAAVASVKQYGDYSNLYYTYVNEVARRCAQEFPGLILTTALYSNARRVPVGMKIEPNVAVGFVTKIYTFNDPKAVAAQEKIIQQFSDLGAKWFIHDWNFAGVSPRLYSKPYVDFLRWGKAHGMLGAYVEYSPGEHWYLDGAKYWILTQILANPDLDTGTLWKTYCDDMYGAASDDMYSLFMHFQDVYAQAGTLITPADLPRQTPALFTAKDLAYERGLLEDALAKTKNDADIQARLAVVMRQFRGHELFAQAVYEPNYLDVTWKGTGVNKPLLDFYVNDDASTLTAAIDYYNTKFTVPPDSNFMSKGLGLLPSLINNYTRGYGDLLQQIRTVAATSVDNKLEGQARVDALNAASIKLVQENLPAKYQPAQVQKLEGVLGKSMLIPIVAQMPTIDGDISDAVWQQAAPLNDWTLMGTFAVPRDKTEGKIMRVGDKLVIALKAEQAGTIFADTQPETTTGTRIWHESAFEIFLSPLPKPGETVSDVRYAQYVINARGAFRGFGTARDNRDGVTVAAKFDPDNHQFTIEAAIPLKASGYDYTSDKTLLFNIARDVNSSSKQDLDASMSWYPIMTDGYADSRTAIYFGGN